MQLLPRPLPMRWQIASGLPVLLACASAQAGNFQTEDGVDVRWSLGTTLGTNWRASSADPALISLGNGGLSGIQNDNGNLNYDRNKVFSTALTVIGDVDVKKNGLGFFGRAKGWYDYTLTHQGVPHGSYANGYVPGAKLDDSDFDSTLSKFKGVALLDAYVYNTFDLPGARQLTVKLGNQVVNWGESLFVPGINQFGAFDITAAHRPGAQVKEILLPIPQVFASLTLTEGLSIEGFYQFKWKRDVLDGCGTYWSAANIINCSSTGTLVGAGPFTDQQMHDGIAALGGANFQTSLGPERTPSNSGQFGLAARYRAAAIDTDLGFYYAQYNARVPNLSAVTVPTTIPGSIWGATIPGVSRAFQSQLDWSAEKIKVFGLSASTVIGGWSVFGELSHTKDLPVQINGTDLLNGLVGGIGPVSSFAATPNGQYIPGYDRKSKTQLQIATLQLVPRVLGAENLTLVAEIAAQTWSGIADSDRRYGRAFVYGSGPVVIPGLGDICGPNAAAQGAGIAPLNPNSSYCENKGYATKNVFGYRVLLELSYPDLFAGVNVKPRVFLSHDVKGWSADGLFSEGRIVLAPGVHFDYAKKYSVDFSYSRFARAKYDEFHDRDFFSLVAGINF